MMIWFASSTGSNYFIPVPNRLPIPAAMISNVVFISVVLSCLKTYHMFINSLESLSSLNGVRPQNQNVPDPNVQIQGANNM